MSAQAQLKMETDFPNAIPVAKLEERGFPEIKSLAHLRKKAKRVDFTPSVKAGLESLVIQMRDTLHKSSGVGLHASQVKNDLSVFVMEVLETKATDGNIFELARHQEDFIVMVNPRIRERSKEKTIFPERCLSLPGEQVWMSRHKEILVDYQDIHGNYQQPKWLRGFMAIVFQHEFDHGEGKLITDGARFPIDRKTFELVHGILTDPTNRMSNLLARLQVAEAEYKANNKASYAFLMNRLKESDPKNGILPIPSGSFLTDDVESAAVIY